MKKIISIWVISLFAFVLYASEKSFVDIKVFNETGTFIDNIYYGKTGNPKLPNTVNLGNHQFVLIQLEFNETYTIRLRDNEGNFYKKTDVRFSSISGSKEIYIKKNDIEHKEEPFLDKVFNKTSDKPTSHEILIEDKSKNKKEKKNKNK